MEPARRLQAVGKDLYYSPNCDRSLTLEEDPFLQVDKNPFQPDKTRPLNHPRISPASHTTESASPKRYTPHYPTFHTLCTPRVWTLSFGWMAFILMRYWDPGYPFDRLKRIPYPLSVGLPGELTYSMPQPFIQSWGKLESELYGAVTRLKSKSSAPMVLPFLPWAHGYRLVFKNPRSYDRAVASSRNWFSVWWGALSFLIAYSETKRDAFSLRGYVPLWHVELEPEVDAAWIDGVFRSVICDFSYNPNRIGCILDIANPKPHQPPLSWFIEHGIPVWYRWGPQEISSADPSLAPPPEMLTGSPERPLTDTTKPSEDPRHLHPVEPEPTPSPPKQASKPEPAWVAHFKRHEEIHARWLEKESAVERQAREARAANPPYSKVRVYEWYPSEKDPDVYERIPVGKKYSRDTLSLYSSTQKIYDPFCNMWDCCDKFGKEDDLDPDEWTIDDLDLPLPVSMRNEIIEMHQDHFSDDGGEGSAIDKPVPLPSPATETTPSSPTPASVYTPLPVSNLPSSGATTLVEDEQELLTETTNWLAVSLEEEVNRVFGLYYGFVSPLPSNTITAEDGPKIRKEFTRLLGLSNDMNPPEEYFSSNHYRSVLRFIAAHSRRQSPHPGSWDLRDDVVHPLKHSPRFRHLRIVDIPHSTDIEVVDKGLSDCVPRYYFFDFPSSRNPWKLALLNALDALFVCRLPPDFDDNDVVVALTQRGISFRLFFPRRLIRYPSYRTPSYCPLPVRPLNHKFTKADYDSYINTRTLVLAQPHMQAAIRRGGVIWRLAITTLGLADVQNVVGCGGVLSTRIPDYDGEYVEDGLTARELDLICGAYMCIDSGTGHTAIKSWWPLARAYERSDCGENYGHWCDRTEAWYLKRLHDIENAVENFDQPLAFQQWKSLQRGLRSIRCFHNSLESSSYDFIARFLEHRPPLTVAV